MAESVTWLKEVEYELTLEDAGSADWKPSNFDCTEGISELYQLSLELVTTDVDADLEELLGAGLELEIDRNGKQRYITGIIRRVDFAGLQHDRLYAQVYIVPAAWALKQRNDSRHWQNLSVVEILQDVLTEPLADFERTLRLDLNGTYPKREFCAQYRETDFDFACRLMAEEGIYFYFDFPAGGKEVLVLCDNNAALPAVVLGKDGPITIYEANIARQPEESIQTFGLQRRLQSTAVVQRDFDWKAPAKPPTAETREPDARGREREIYDPGERRYEVADAASLSAKKLEAIVAKGTVSTGDSNVTGFTPGHHFEIVEHHIAELAVKGHLITRVAHSGTFADTNSVGQSSGTTYSNHFETIPLDVEFRAPRLQRPLVQGPQTAVVTGPGSEEIHVDPHGRVKVILGWDRLSPPDDTSSFWVRVAQMSAGAGWGSMFIPRVGMEVVVEFLDGNPDRPLITGCVYNAANPPPYALPADRTKSTIKSNSSPGGGGFNELRFEDLAGSEELYLHAQKDLTIKTLNNKTENTIVNETLTIGKERAKTVGANETETIAQNKTISVGAAHSETIGSTRSVSVGGSDSQSVGGSLAVTVGGSSSESVGGTKSISASAMSVSCGAGMATAIGGVAAESSGAKEVSVVGGSGEKVGGEKSVDAGAIINKATEAFAAAAGTDMIFDAGKKVAISAGDSLEITGKSDGTIMVDKELTIGCGEASITMKANGDIVIKGTKISLDAAGDLKLKGAKIVTN